MILSNGESHNPQEAIFPIVELDTKKGGFECLGTGFFIHPGGIFVTAKHLFDCNPNKAPRRFIVQHLTDGTSVMRDIYSITAHTIADIAVGLLGAARDYSAQEFIPSPGLPLPISFTSLPVGTAVKNYGYPRFKRKKKGREVSFSFKGYWNEGEIFQIGERSAKLNSPHYITDMKMLSGASGGPVLANGYVVGVNSTSFKMFGKENISLVTPLGFLSDLGITFYNDDFKTINEIIEAKMITLIK